MMSAVATEPIKGGNFYAEGLYCETDVRRGVTRARNGTRLCCLTTDFLLGFRRAIIDECGPAADLVFHSCGKKWGAFAARRFDQDMQDFAGKPLREFTMAEFQSCLADLFSHHGWGVVRLDLSHHDQGLIVVTVSDPIFASLSGPSEKPVDSLMAGVLGGFFATLFEQDLDCVQTSCRARGDQESRFVIGLAARLAGVPNLLAAGKSHAQIMKELANIRL
jgi:predicted hydrocarbon binding protein